MTNFLNKLAPALTALFASAFAVSATPPQPRAGEPLVGLTSAQMQRFQEGRDFYSTPLSIAKGLGPAFNQPSCAACHEQPLGGWGATSVTHFGNLVGGNFNFLTALGGPVLQRQAISPTCIEVQPSAAIANHVRVRVTPSVLAFGLVEAISDASIIALEDPNDANGDGISGRAHRVATLEDPTGAQRIGRFGWKAQIATVLSFSGDAARNEMGLTNSVVPTETAPNGNAVLLADCDSVPEIEDQPNQFGVTFVAGVTAFQRYLGPPPQSPRSGMAGEAIFNAVGCVKCHTAQFLTPNDPALEGAIRNKAMRVYSDFLLHDMGALADGIPDGQATGVEMKTPPLWNLRTRPVMLHNGSVSAGDFATKVTAAINAHAGEATASRNAFAALGATDRAAFLAFLDSLGRNDYDADSDGLITRSDFALIVRNSTDANVTADEAWAVADLNQNHLIDADEVTQLRDMLGVPVDCNQNGVADWTEIATGASDDLNANGTPDECDQSNCTARTKRVSGTGGAIPDLGGGSLTRTISVVAPTGNPAIQSMRVTLNITHTWLSDLTITLRRGSDPAITLHTGCGSFHDINGRYLLTDTAWEGTPAGLAQICESALIDGGGTNSETRFTFTPGTFRPTQGTASTGFQSMRGQPMGAVWTLAITDSRSNDVGTLQGWSIDFRYADSNPTDCDNIGGADCAQLAANPALDCDGNGVIDTCESLSGDCDGDGVRDRCEIAAGDGQDCNGNGQLDSCDIAAGIVADCNSNGVVDACELADGDGADSDSDLVLDRCERDFGDLNLDGMVSAPDLALLLGAWGTPGVGFGDFGGDGIVNAADLAFLLSKWSAVPSWAQPTLSGVTPAAGPVSGGTAITLTGTNLDGATSLTVGGAAAANLVVVSATRLTAVTPAGSTGARDIVVTTPRGVATLAGGFNYQSASPPTISSVSPNSGSTVGATAITITGTNLTGASSVTIGGVAATSVSVVNATTVTAVTPAGTAGAKTVSITTPSGTASLTNGFTYVAGPTISGISPNAGVTSGGAAITITGTGFTGATGVTIGGVATQSLSVVNATTITATAPALAAGLYSVVVTTPFGVGTLANAYTAQVSLPPTISSVSPNTGPLSGGTTITITGTNLTGTSSVTIDGVAATSVSVVSSTTVTAVTPAATAGAKTVSITTPGGTANLTSGFTYTTAGVWYTVLEQSPDPAVVTDVTLRNAITATGYPWRVRDIGTQIEMVLVPGGTFVMGCTASNAYACTAIENPTHSVTITNAFYMGRYEVTQAQWQAKMGSNPSYFQPPNTTTPDTSRPVEQVSWNTIQGFLTATGMQLPTEAQWEYACRAGTTTAFHGFTGYLSGTNDDTLVGNIAWYGAFSGGNSGGQTHAVGGKAANALGLHDMLGNVFEWCGDWIGDYSLSAQTNPAGPASGSYRVLRGGSWYYFTDYVRSSSRGGTTPDDSGYDSGFRVARAPLLYGTPTISSVSPNTGPTTGGTAITITGTNLTGASSVTIGGVAATSVSVVSSTTVTAVTPAGTVGAKTVSVTTPGGTANLTSGFTYGAAPTISSVSPNVGPTTGGTAITITGTNLTGTSSVSVGGNAATSVVVVNATTVTATTPSGAAGAANVSLTTPYGSPTASGPFTYQLYATPTISSVSPNTGSTSGGTAITITGTNLTGANSVTIGGVAATSVSVVNATTVTAVTPAGTIGVKTVSVTTPGGTANLTSGFTYGAGPTISSVSPNVGPTTGGTAITITGTNLTGTSSVSVSGNAATSVVVVNATTVTATTPSGAAGAANVSLTTPYGSPTASGAFTYQLYATPTISSVSPNTGPTTGGTAITITGTNLTGASSVTIGGVAATSVSVVSSTTVTAVTPAGTIGATTVSITTPGGTANLTSGFTYGAGPTISSISPNVGPTTGGTAITITGTNLTGTSSVSVGGNAATSVVVVNATTVTAVTPSGAAGAANVSLTTPYGSPTASGAFTYQLYATPTISSVSPNTGPTSGGTAITITGTNLTGASSVTIGGVAATSVSVVSSTTVTAVTPAGTAGAKTVSITTPGGTANLTSGFTYTSAGVWYTVLEQSPDPAVVTDVTLRNAITATGYPWRVRDIGTQIEMVLVPGGTFTMGCTASNAYACFSGENPTHSVTITNAFYMGRYEVTQAQWQARMGSNPSYFQPPNTTTPDTSRPVEQVSWNTIQGFLTATGMQLPTEAQWEYACRAGTTTAFHGFTGYLSGTNDDTLVGNIAWYGAVSGGNSGGQTHAVGGKAANALGLHDMLGNVFEWCGDWIGDYSSSAQTNPAGPASGSYRVLRGGSWYYFTDYVRSSSRGGTTPDDSGYDSGFRVARAPLLYGTPTISSVSPNTGPTTGATAITITGTNLTGASSVTIDGVAATSVSVVSSTTVTAVTPAGAAGAKTVSVTTPGGTASLTSGFTYTSASVWYTVLEQNPNPAVVTDVTLRNAITATGYPWRVRDNGTQIEMVLVPGGTFTMGCTASNTYACATDENPTHQVTITNAFYIGRYEVTQAQWLAKMGSNPSFFKPPTYTADTSRPVETVSWNTIQGFLTATGMQLPTEAQWEYACRAGTTTAFHGFTGYLSGTNDDTLVGNFAWYFGNNGALGTPTYGTKPVGGKAANGLGLHDMGGNVYEWCGDWSGAYSAGAQTNPTGPATGTLRVLRGGSWSNSAGVVRSSDRSSSAPDFTYSYVGFRVARAPL